MVSRAMKHPKIEILWNRTLEKVIGDQVVRKIVLKDVQSGQMEEREAGGVFFCDWPSAEYGFLQGQLKLDPVQYIIVKKGNDLYQQSGCVCRWRCTRSSLSASGVSGRERVHGRH